MKIGTVLDINEIFEFFSKDEDVLSESLEIVQHGKTGDRSNNQKLNDSIKGLALQYAIAAYLSSLGYEVELAPEGVLHYDFKVNSILVDIKGRWDGKYFNVSKFERERVEELKCEVLYMCIDYFKNKDQFVTKGECWSYDLTSGAEGTQYVQKFSDIL